MFGIIGGVVVYGFALYGLATYLSRPTAEVTQKPESGRNE